MSNPLVSVIIPHWNGIEVLSECLESLVQTKYPNFEIIVVDNASTDGSPDWVPLNFPQVKLIENDQNHGYAGGCNRGAKVASGEYFLFLNNDTIQDNHWMDGLIDFMNLNPDVAAVQPKILNYFERDRFDYAGGAGGWIDVLGFPFARGRVFFEREKDVGQYDRMRPIFWASGTAIMVRKSDFQIAGGFDETFFAHQEEIDLCWKFRLMGKETWAIPSSVVYHKNAVTLPMFSQKKQYLNHRNSFLMVLSNYSLPLTLYMTPIRLALEFVALVYSLVLFDKNHFFGIIQSLYWIITHPHIIWKRRRLVKKIRVVKDKKILPWLYWGSVVFDYYIRRKKRSADIVKE
jgi:GT2 family glycosyltransferase